jgi:hypothetical protein
MEGVVSEWVELLQQNLDGVPKKDLEFAASLLNQAKSGKKPLTDKQMYWVSKLASQAMGIPDFTRPAEVNVGEFTGVIDLFKKAGTTLKYPRITLKTEGGQKLMLTLSGPTSKYPGVVNVTDGAGYGGNIWFGRVEASGKFTPGHASEKIKNDLTSILTKLASAPHRVAADYGKLTGSCCFCSTPLTDPKSLAVGYGPQCAKQWHLPWGVKAEAA